MVAQAFAIKVSGKTDKHGIFRVPVHLGAGVSFQPRMIAVGELYIGEYSLYKVPYNDYRLLPLMFQIKLVGKTSSHVQQVRTTDTTAGQNSDVIASVPIPPNAGYTIWDNRGNSAGFLYKPISFERPVQGDTIGFPLTDGSLLDNNILTFQLGAVAVGRFYGDFVPDQNAQVFCPLYSMPFHFNLYIW